MATNLFLPFATSSDANALSDADYASAVASTGAFSKGVQTGIASAKQANKVWRQTTIWSATLGQIITDAGQDANDGQTITLLKTNFLNALAKTFATQDWVTGNFVETVTATSGDGDLRFSLAAYGSGYGAPYLRGWNAAGTSTDYILATQTWTITKLGSFVATSTATSGNTDLKVDSLRYSVSVGAPYIASYNSSGTATNYLLATQDWVANNFFTKTQSYSAFVGSTSATSGSGDLHVAVLNWSQAVGNQPYIIHYNSDGSVSAPIILATQDWVNSQLGNYLTVSAYNNDVYTNDARVINLPYGHRIQSFTTTVPNRGDSSITFPVAFSGNPTSVEVTAYGNGDMDTATDGWSSTGFILHVPGNSTNLLNISVTAIGPR